MSHGRAEEAAKGPLTPQAGSAQNSYRARLGQAAKRGRRLSAQRNVRGAAGQRRSRARSSNGAASVLAVNGLKARLHQKPARGAKRHGQAQWGNWGPAVLAGPGSVAGVDPAVQVFQQVNQDQLLAAYVAAMQSEAGSQVAAAGHMQHAGMYAMSSSNGGHFVHPVVLDWNSCLSRQGSGASPGRFNELMRLLPSPKFAHARGPGPAPETPQSLLASPNFRLAVHSPAFHQYVSSPGHATHSPLAAGAAMCAAGVPSYAYQHYFSSYWAQQAVPSSHLSASPSLTRHTAAPLPATAAAVPVALTQPPLTAHTNSNVTRQQHPQPPTAAAAAPTAIQQPLPPAIKWHEQQQQQPSWRAPDWVIMPAEVAAGSNWAVGSHVGGSSSPLHHLQPLTPLYQQAVQPLNMQQVYHGQQQQHHGHHAGSGALQRTTSSPVSSTGYHRNVDSVHGGKHHPSRLAAMTHGTLPNMASSAGNAVSHQSSSQPIDGSSNYHTAVKHRSSASKCQHVLYSPPLHVAGNPAAACNPLTRSVSSVAATSRQCQISNWNENLRKQWQRPKSQPGMWPWQQQQQVGIAPYHEQQQTHYSQPAPQQQQQSCPPTMTDAALQQPCCWQAERQQQQQGVPVLPPLVVHPRGIITSPVWQHTPPSIHKCCWDIGSRYVGRLQQENCSGLVAAQGHFGTSAGGGMETVRARWSNSGSNQGHIHTSGQVTSQAAGTTSAGGASEAAARPQNT